MAAGDWDVSTSCDSPPSICLVAPICAAAARLTQPRFPLLLRSLYLSVQHRTVQRSRAMHAALVWGSVGCCLGVSPVSLIEHLTDTAFVFVPESLTNLNFA